MVINVTNLLRECELAEPIDPKDEMTDGLERAEEGLRGGIDILRQKRNSAETDPVLQGDSERRVVSAYERAIVTLGGLHDAVIDFRWAIMERDANLESPEGMVFTSASDLIERLQA